MKVLKYLLSGIFLFIAFPALAFSSDNLSSRLSGQILLDVDNRGEAWYVYPGDSHRYYLGTPQDAYSIMKNLSLGISNDNFSKIETSTPERFRGLILLKPEDVGKAYYVNPSDKSLLYLATAADAFKIMSQYSIGIKNSDLKTIPIAKIILNDTGQEISREWQYLGFWGSITQNNIPVLSEPKSDSVVLGKFYTSNTIKVFKIVKADGRIWYQIDGGKYLGAYVDSTFVEALGQPTADANIVVPKEISVDDTWVDVNLSKKVLTLYKYNQVLMSTYVSVGIPERPTITGSYHVWYKLKTTRMKGNPPVALHAYDLPNVPWVMFYQGSYSIHGTYWHDNFGTQRSAGCTNVTISDAKYIFDSTSPVIGDTNSIRPSVDNPGLLIVNHY